VLDKYIHSNLVVNVKPGGTYSNHWVLKSCYLILSPTFRKGWTGPKRPFVCFSPVCTRECWYVLSPTYFPVSYDGIDSVGKRDLFLCRIASIFLLQRLKGNMSGDARDFNNMKTRAVIKSPCKQSAEGNSRHFDRNIRGTCTIVCHRQKLGDLVWTWWFFLLWCSSSVTIPEIIDQIHDLILEDCRISAKSIAEQLGISRERVGSIIHEDLDMRKLSAK